MTDPRLAVITIDGGTWDVFDRYEHVMPTLSGLRQSCASGVLMSTWPPITAPAWSTFLTGVGPGRHGCYFFTTFEEGKLRVLNSKSIQVPTIYEMLSALSRRVVSLNVPMTYPPRPVNGVVLGGMLTPKGATDNIYPEDCRPLFADYEDLLKKERKYIRIAPWTPSSGLYPRWRRNFVDTATHAVRTRGALFARLMRRLDWDLFVVHFHSTDRVQHQCWMTIEGTGEEKWRASEELLLEEFYGELDNQLRLLLDVLDDDVDTIIVSDHGFGRGYDSELVEFFVNSWLADHGYVTLRDSGADTVSPERSRVYRAARWAARRLLPPAARRWLRTAVKGESGDPHEQIDWQNSCAFAAVNGFTAAPNGFIYPARSSQQSNIEGRLREQLLEIKEPYEGRDVFEMIGTCRELYGEDAAEPRPALGFETIFPCFVRGDFVVPEPGRYFRKGAGRCIEGHHRPEGIYLASGRAFQGLAKDKIDMRDVAPSVLRAMGVQPPEKMEGRSFTTGSESEELSEIPEPLRQEPKGARRRDVRENESVRRRLRDLGYIS